MKRNYTKFSNSKNTYLTVFYFVFIFALIRRFLLVITYVYSKESWPITEFLINYQGGFVRRGLLGEFIIKLYYYIGINPYITILFICTSAYLVLLVFFLKSFIKNGFPVFILPFIFFLGNPIINGFLIRKDVLIILFFILILFFSTKKSNFYLILVNLIFITGLLIHESIGFFCFPILLLILISKNNINYKTKNTLIKSIIIPISQVLPSIFTFLCVLYYNGSKIISKQIWNSWNPIIFPIQAENNSQIPASIDGLSWSLRRVLAFTKTTLQTFQDSIYIPMVWLFIFILIYYLLTNTDKLNFKMLNYKPYKNFNKTNISNILILQLFTIIPIIILGVDYGRWVFIWTTSSFAIIVLVSEKELSVLFPRCIFSISTKINDILNLLLSQSKGFLFLLYLIISFPYTYWSLNDAVSKSSLVIVLQFISIGISKTLVFIKEFI